MVRKQKNKVIVDGKVWKTQREVAEHYGVKPNVFNMRINRLGWSPEEALEITERESSARSAIKYKGKNLNRVEVCRRIWACVCDV